MRAAIRPVVATLVSVGAVLAATSAHANVGDTSCTDDNLTCSKGEALLKAQSRDLIRTTAQSDWYPKCDPGTADAEGHCGKLVQASVSIDLAAYPGSLDPLWLVDMGRGALVEARWPTEQAFELMVPTAATKEGTFKITHTIIPQINLYVEIPVIGAFPFSYDATSLVQSVASGWDYKATNAVNFQPWAFEPPVINLVPAPPPSMTPLFTTTILDNSTWKIDLGLTARTSPEFSYRTTRVTLGADAPIVAADGSASLPMVDADFLNVPAVVEGEITVHGSFNATPNGTIVHKSSGITVPINIDIPATTYTEKTPVAVKFPATTVHIPLPNVKAPKTVVDLGKVQVGSPAEKSVAIANTGELGASLSFKSDNPQFSMIDTVVAAPKTDYPLVIRFAPTGEGPQKAIITVKSNDPDSPTQTFEVQAYGTLAPSDDGESKGTTPGSGDLGDEEFEPGADTGCGCRTAPTHSSYGALGGLGLAALFFVRRRRQRAA